ncbi:MAG: phytanoyl-CoA dioxygenase family protein [Lautropia sp.]
MSPTTAASPHKSAGLSPSEVREYQEKGYLFPFPALSAEEVASYRGRIEAFEAEYGARAGRILRQKSHIVLTFAAELVRLEPVLDKVESLIGPDILCWSTSFFIKDPGDHKFVSWHQDAQYWGLEGDKMATAWIALAPSTPESGNMRVIPGSHRRVLDHRDVPNSTNMLTRGQEIAATVDESLAVDVTLAPGQFSLHHELIVHGSAANLSGDRRIGLAVRYIHPSARQIVDAKDTASLVRGVDRFGHFEHEPRPRADMAPEAAAYLEKMLAERAGGIYRR